MILFLTLLACVSDPRGGTAVGNPTGFTVDTAPVTTFKLDSGSAVIEEVGSRACDGTDDSERVGHEVDLYGSTVVLAGMERSCVLTIAFAGPLVYVGQHQGQEVRLEVPLADVSFRAPPGGIPGGSRLLVQLGGVDWVHSAQLAHGGLAEGQAQVVADTLQAGSLLYTDVDGDFALGAAELEAGPMARALPSTPGEHADVGAGVPPARRTAPGAGTSERLYDDDGGAPADDAADGEDEASTDDTSIDPDGAAGTSDHGSAEERASVPDEHAAEGSDTSADGAEDGSEDDGSGAEPATDASETSADPGPDPAADGSTSPDDEAADPDTRPAEGTAAEPDPETSTDPDDGGEPDAGASDSPESTDEPDAGEPGADDASSTEHDDPEDDEETEDDRTDSGRRTGRGRNPLPGEPRGPWRDRSAE